jgi:hypothetical protein
MCEAALLGEVADQAPGRIVVNMTTLYFITANNLGDGKVYACPKTGCIPPTTLVSGMGNAADLALDMGSGQLFASDSTNSHIYTCNTSSCGAMTTLTVTGQGFAGLDVGPNELFAVYSVGSGDMEPYQLQPNGIVTADLGKGTESAMWIAASGNGSVYWTSVDHVRFGKINIAGSAGNFTSKGPFVGTLAANMDFVAYMSQGTTGFDIMACSTSVNPCASPTVLATSEMASGQQGGLLVDPKDNVFWTARDAAGTHVLLRSCPAAGCGGNPKTLASVTTVGVGAPGGVASDMQNFYFTFSDTNDTYVYRVPK